MSRKIAAGNWKMNGTGAALSELTDLAQNLPANAPEVIICPPAPLLSRAVDRCSTHNIHIGAQDCHTQTAGAFTGDTSAEMIADAGAHFVIVGHSERREGHSESDAIVCAKATAAHTANLTPLICIGEALNDRDAGKTLDIIGAQLAGSVPDGLTPTNTVIAYEPIWAIGTGKVPSFAQIAEVHDFIRAQLAQRFGTEIAEATPLLYGGSVKPDNAAAIFEAENVNGALVGGASLKATDFAPIIAALAAS